MLSLSNVGSGAAAANYYETADDYYTGDRSPSVWWGRSAEALGLAGPVERELFAQLLDGRLPSGEQLHHAAAGRRGGTDATFSAPKSISLQALVGGDVRLIEAHQKAVDRALAYAQMLAACRVTEAGKTATAVTGNLLVARFEHDLSRACDPQLHTHCVLINATQRADGQWRALDNEAVYRHKMLLGALYRAELAREVQQLGYDVRLTHMDGRFELAHVGEQQVRAFSQRSAAIEEHLQKNGQAREEASAWDKKLAAVVTREKKTAVDRHVLMQEWEALSREHGVVYAVPEMPVRSPTERVGVEVGFDDENIGLARDAIMADAVAHLSERQSVFGRVELMRQALERGVGTVTVDELQMMLERAEQTGLLIRSGERYTTQAAQQQEAEILALEVQGRESLEPIHRADKAPRANMTCYTYP
jgi:conjugative relaxase-like TrwC/TraI family protein